MKVSGKVLGLSVMKKGLLPREVHYHGARCGGGVASPAYHDVGSDQGFVLVI